MAAQVVAKGLRPHVLRRLLCFSLFWHALDVIWVGVLTLVYLIGARRMEGNTRGRSTTVVRASKTMNPLATACDLEFPRSGIRICRRR